MDFCHDAYIAMLQVASKNAYRFYTFSQINHCDFNRICLLRHDVDADPYAAFKMAELETSLGVRSTYFFMFRSPMYNLLSRANHCLVEKIIEMGHELGLHYDATFNPSNKSSLQEMVTCEAEFMERMFGCTVRAVSFHQPDEKILNEHIKLSMRINTYNKLDMDGFEYVSDSNKIWKNYHPKQIFMEGIYSKLHLLIHPMWWMNNDNNSTKACWDRALFSNLDRTQEQLLSTERAYGNRREIIIK